MITLARATGMALLLGGATALLGHFVWVGPMAGPLKVGQDAAIMVGNGHAFLGSESPAAQDGLKVWAITPAGASQPVAVSVADKFLKGSFPVKTDGVYRVVFTQDRGVMSRTPKGVKAGGRDQHPDATEAFKLFRSGIAYVGTPGKAFGKEKPVGLDFEMVPEKTADGVILTVLAGGKPLAGADISLAWPLKDEVDLGKTGADGKFTYKFPAGAKSPALFVAESKVKAAAGAKFDVHTYASAVALYW